MAAGGGWLVVDAGAAALLAGTADNNNNNNEEDNNNNEDNCDVPLPIVTQAVQADDIPQVVRAVHSALGEGRRVERVLLTARETPRLASGAIEEILEVADGDGAVSVPGGICFVPGAALSLFGAGVAAGGVVADIGHGGVTLSTINDCLRAVSVRHLDELGGRDLAQFQTRLVEGRNAEPAWTRDEHRAVRESGAILSVAPSSNEYRELMTALEGIGNCGDGWDEQAVAPGAPQVFQLPDGKAMAVRGERFAVPEALFQPHLVGKSAMGLSAQLWDLARNCGPPTPPVVVTGGGAGFPGLRRRILHDLDELGGLHWRASNASNNSSADSPGIPAGDVRIVTTMHSPAAPLSPDVGAVDLAAWRGGLVLAAVAAEWLDDLAVTRTKWHEEGARCLPAAGFV